MEVDITPEVAYDLWLVRWGYEGVCLIDIVNTCLTYAEIFNSLLDAHLLRKCDVTHLYYLKEKHNEYI